MYPEVEQLLMETLGWESLMAQMFRNQDQLKLIENFDNIDGKPILMFGNDWRQDQN